MVAPDLFNFESKQACITSSMFSPTAVACLFTPYSKHIVGSVVESLVDPMALEWQQGLPSW